MGTKYVAIARDIDDKRYYMYLLYEILGSFSRRTNINSREWTTEIVTNYQGYRVVDTAVRLLL